MIGHRLAKLRGEMTQKELADKMRAKGWKWVQQTVGTVEKGERSLRLAEASDLSDILGVSVEALLQTTAQVMTISSMQKQIAKIDDAAHLLGVRANQFEDIRQEAQAVLSSIENVPDRQWDTEGLKRSYEKHLVSLRHRVECDALWQVGHVLAMRQVRNRMDELDARGEETAALEWSIELPTGRPVVRFGTWREDPNGEHQEEA